MSSLPSIAFKKKQMCGSFYIKKFTVLQNANRGEIDINKQGLNNEYFRLRIDKKCLKKIW